MRTARLLRWMLLLGGLLAVALLAAWAIVSFLASRD